MSNGRMKAVHSGVVAGSAPFLKSGYRFLICSLLFSPAPLLAGEWSAPVTLSRLSTVQFRWRLLDLDADTKRNRIEWSFSNESDSAVTFHYQVVSELNESEQLLEHINQSVNEPAVSDFRGLQMAQYTNYLKYLQFQKADSAVIQQRLDRIFLLNQ